MPDKSSSQQESYFWLDEAQLGNFISQNVKFLYCVIAELSEDEKKDHASHPLLKGAVYKERVGIVEFVTENTDDTNHPVVLLCRDSQLSREAAENLIIAGYKNVFVVEGGLDEIS